MEGWGENTCMDAALKGAVLDLGVNSVVSHWLRARQARHFIGVPAG